MIDNCKKLWNQWNRNIVVNKRELVLGITACTLAGVVVGMLLSPRKTQLIASCNGNTHHTITAPEQDTEEA